MRKLSVLCNIIDKKKEKSINAYSYIKSNESSGNNERIAYIYTYANSSFCVLSKEILNAIDNVFNSKVNLTYD